jgi:hypothetical protein
MRRFTAVLIACGLAAATAAEPAGATLRVRDRLTFAHADRTPVAFGREVRVWCGRWASDVPVRSIHVIVGGRTPRWELHAVVADVRRKRVVALPNAFVFDHPRGALLFATEGPIEVNSDREESTGRIRFLRVGCGPRLRIAFRVSGHLGSELSDGEPLSVRGSFSASNARG